MAHLQFSDYQAFTPPVLDKLSLDYWETVSFVAQYVVFMNKLFLDPVIKKFVVIEPE